MRTQFAFAAGLLSLAGLLAFARPSAAHPGSGIVVDDQGRVWFMDTGFGLWELDPSGRLTPHGGPGGHFLTLDPKGRFREDDFSQLAPGDVEVSRRDPTLLVGTSYPVSVGADDAFYYPQRAGPGRVRILRMAPGEQAKPFADLPPASEMDFDGKSVDAEWIWGLAAGPDGSLYYTEQNAVRRISADGTVAVVADRIEIADCERPPAFAGAQVQTSLYGLAVTPQGVVYVAVPSCSAVLKILPDKTYSVALRATNRWSPQGVAVQGETLYVLEYDYIAAQDRRDWLPRVRRLDPDGSVSIIAQVIERPGQERENPDASATYAGARPGEQREILGIPLCWCPAGEFTFGSPASEAERRPGENQVPVVLSKGFWMGKYETTQGDWKKVFEKLPGELTAELSAGDEYPVGNVNFTESESFCEKLTARARQQAGLPRDWEFRLPTEAQWEYACRAGTTTATAFGDSISSTQANFLGDKPFHGGEPGPSLGRAEKAGRYQANAWGLHDMHGNSCEWCRDWFHLRYPGGVDPDLHDALASATKNRTGDVSRSRRGSCWADPGWASRSAFRQRFEPERRYDHIGFRIMLCPVK